MERTLRLVDIASRLGVSHAIVYIWVKSGCPFTQTGNRKLFNEQEVRDWHTSYILKNNQLKKSKVENGKADL